LFKSKDITRSKTELLVMVTPEATYPLLATDPKPLPHMPKKFLPEAVPQGASGQKPIHTAPEAPSHSAK
jgi:Flp pilus assembly secretin CpaC